MIAIDEQVVVARPRDAVYAHLARVGSLPGWLPTLREAELLDGDALAVGSRLRLVLAVPGRDVEAIGEVTALRPGEHVAFRTLDAPAGIAAACDLTALDGGATRLRVTGSVELPGLLRFGEGLVRDRIRKEAPAALAELKARLEAAIPGPG